MVFHKTKDQNRLSSQNITSNSNIHDTTRNIFSWNKGFFKGEKVLLSEKRLERTVLNGWNGWFFKLKTVGTDGLLSEKQLERTVF